MQLLFKMIMKRKLLVFASIAATTLSAAAMLWWNAQLGILIDTITISNPIPHSALILAITTMLAMGMLNFAGSYINGYTCEMLTHDLRMGYARYFSQLPFAESEKLNAGEQLSKLQNEIVSVSAYLKTDLFLVFGELLRFTMTFTWFILINPALALAVNLPSFIIIIYVIWSSKIIGLAIEQSQQAKGEMNRYTDTLLTLFPIIRLYDSLRMALTGYTDAVTVWENHVIKAERTRARLMSLSGFLSGIPLLLLFLIGGRMAISGTLTIGMLYIFLNLSGNVSGVLPNMPGRIAAFRQFSANMKRLAPYIVYTANEGEK
ncbi:MAG: ABC transporter transmembrane domain-containing protein [Defluviitaleaceae bacterium]|nr:ABC transporter transmembrane domain-containing protein [Defluviitaleaceae bacterium]